MLKKHFKFPASHVRNVITILFTSHVMIYNSLFGFWVDGGSQGLFINSLSTVITKIQIKCTELTDCGYLLIEALV